MENKVFPCNGGGKWFPAGRAALLEIVDACLKKADARSDNPLAIIAPHAGYPYSGPGEGYAYKTLQGKEFRRVIILGPSHYSGFRGVSVLAGYDACATPLGEVALDKPGVQALLQEKNFAYRAEAHTPEHSVENQIPFLQRVLPRASILCCVVGFMDPVETAGAGRSIAKLLDGHTVIVVSSDFTHYGRAFDFAPFKDNIRANIEKLDKGAVDKIAAGDAAGFHQYIEKTGATICGRNAIEVMLYALSGKARGRLLHYYTSSDESNDYSHAVAYASIVMEAK